MTTLTPTVSLEYAGAIALVTIDNPPVNALSHSVRAGLAAAAEAVGNDADIRAVVLLCAGRSFVAGADITEFGRPLEAPGLEAVMSAIEGLPQPVVCALHGRALGGGLELALACDYRIAVPDARFGLPEVHLGLIPGAGGTQRLPRLVGLPLAIDMILQGQEIDADTARDAGLLDQVADGDLRTAALAYARTLVDSQAGRRLTRDLPPPAMAREALDAGRALAARKFRLEPARTVALDMLEAACDQPIADALKTEHSRCVALLDTAESRALRHNFAAERQVRKPGGDATSATPRPVSTVAVVGLGTMGSGMAACFALAGYTVLLQGRDADAGGKGRDAVERLLASRVKRGSLAAAQFDACLDRLVVCEQWSDLARADLLLEAASEDQALKHTLFEQLGAVAREGAIIASNTSYLDIDALAAASGRPADVCGMHFFNPAHIMKLVENVRGAQTAPEVQATITDVAARIGKIPVTTGVCEGFIVNRMLAKRSREGFFMLEEGAKPEQIDRALKAFGFPMGPYALADLAGIDLQYAARQARLHSLSERERAADFVDQLYALGRYGQKTGEGWYLYGQDRKPRHNPATDELLAAHARARGITPREFSDDEIRQRCVYAMINEGAKILDEGIASRPEDVDVAMVNGIGFPATTGGPLWLAGEIGLGKVRDTMARFADEVGPGFWQPSALIEQLADAGSDFYTRR